MTIEVTIESKKWFRRRGIVTVILALGIPAIALGRWLISPRLFDEWSSSRLLARGRPVVGRLEVVINGPPFHVIFATAQLAA